MFGLGLDETVVMSMAALVGFGLPSALVVLIFVLVDNKWKCKRQTSEYRPDRIASR